MTSDGPRFIPDQEIHAMLYESQQGSYFLVQHQDGVRQHLLPENYEVSKDGRQLVIYRQVDRLSLPIESWDQYTPTHIPHHFIAIGQFQSPPCSGVMIYKEIGA